MLDVYFSHPGNVCEIKDRIKNDIKHADKKIYISMYAATDNELLNLILSREKDINIKMVLDKNNYQNQYNDDNIAFLYEKSSGRYSNMHNKILIIDEKVWIGSYNLSYNASKNSWESMICTDDNKIVDKCIEEFTSEFLYAKSEQIDEKSLSCKDKLFVNSDKTIFCKTCSDAVDDILKHIVFTISIIKNKHCYPRCEWEEDQDGGGSLVRIYQDKSDIDIKYNKHCKKNTSKGIYKCSKCSKCKESLKDIILVSKEIYSLSESLKITKKKKIKEETVCKKCVLEYLDISIKRKDNLDIYNETYLR